MKIWWLLPIAVLVAGCGDPGMDDLHEFIKETKAKRPGPIPPIPEVRQTEGFVYVPGGRRDPFEPERELEEQEVAQVDSGPRPDPNRRKEELEAYALDTLRMVGTLQQEDVTWGLVQTNDGTIHRVKQDNYLGQNHGRIIRVSDSVIELTELVPAGRGYIEREAALSMGEE